jgi:outer membrane receptor protein involved in Fe transport
MKSILLCFLFLLFIAGNGFGQPETSDTITSLPPVIVTSDNNLQSGTLSKIAIRSRGINNSQEILSMVPGLFIGQHAGGGKAEQLFLRGFDADHGTDVNISVDGVPVNMVSHAHGQGYADLHFVIPELVESVHYNKGPYYADKGDFATAGYAALITKNILPASMIKVEAGRFNSFRTVAMMNILPEKKRSRERSFFAAAELMKTRGYFDNPQDLNRVNFFTRYQSSLGAKSLLNISADYLSSKWMASGQIPVRAVHGGLISFYGAIDPDEGGETRRKSINAQLTTRLTDATTIKNQFYIAAYDFDLFSDFTFYKLDSIRGDQIRQKEKRILSGYNGNISFTHFIGNAKLNSVAGASLRYDITSGSGLFHTYKRTQIINTLMEGDIDQLNAAAFIKEDLALSEKLGFGAAIRIDKFFFRYNDLIQDNTTHLASELIASPKFNIAYQVADNIQIYLSAGKGFHSNDARISSNINRRDVLPAAYGTDVGVIWKPIQKLFINAAVWYLKVDQELVYAGDEGIVEVAGRTKRRGIDFLWRYQASKKLLIDFDASYAHGRFIDKPKGYDRIPLAPVFTSTGGVIYKTNSGVGAGIRCRWMGKRPANENYSVTAKGYFINDMMISYAAKNYELKLSAANLLNVKWKETQFDTESRLLNEPYPVSEIHFTAGTPLFIKAGFTWFLKY